MKFDVIRKQPSGREPAPYMEDYAAFRDAFSWESARTELAGLPSGGVNIAHEAVVRHVREGDSERVALRWIGREGDVTDFTYAELDAASSRFANVLRGLGIDRGERVYSLLGRVPALYQAVIGTLKNGSVYCPLFSAFGPEPIRARMAIGEAAVLLTTSALYRRKVVHLRESLPRLRHVLLVDGGAGEFGDETVHDLAALMTTADATFEIVATYPDDMALLHFTSGTTGKPKGAIHVHDAVTAHRITGKLALDLHPGDLFWCTADPGWVTGTSYGIISPLANGATLIVDEAEFEAERWYRILQDHQVAIWYTAPTAIRMLMRLGGEIARNYDFSALRFMASVGEPLNPEAVVWGQEVFGMPFHDNWWQTETGGIMIANYPAMDVRPGSMGKPLPGIKAAIVERDEAGDVAVIDEPDTEGELALRRGWPSMFRGYLGEDERYHRSFVGDWYLTGDLARRDADGYFWFVGRSDDVIKTSGHMVGPFEVESALMEHPAVAEVAVIGKPDPVAMEIVKAFVSLKSGHEPDDALRRELLAHARRRLGAAVAPKEIDFLANLPRTRSGKIMRRLLKARELGLPEGDTSTLEEGQ